jgi:hypothetical protein
MACLLALLGSLPLGTLNVAAIADLGFRWDNGRSTVFRRLIDRGNCYVRLSLVAMDWVRKQEKIFRILGGSHSLLFLALAATSFYAALHPAWKERHSQQ